MTLSTLPFHRDPGIIGGALVFVGTRVPVRTLLGYLEARAPLDEFWLISRVSVASKPLPRWMSPKTSSCSRCRRPERA
jgi:Protein of unknown function (DUF433)